MALRTLLVLASDAGFYPYLRDTIRSMRRADLQVQDVAVLDLGLGQDHIHELKTMNIMVKPVEHSLWFKGRIGRRSELAYTERLALPNHFPGFDVYFWLDVDLWVQTPDFFTPMIEGAAQAGMACVREDGAGMKRSWTYRRWLYGNMIYNYGPMLGLQSAIGPQINIGVLALHRDAPHWALWRDNFIHCYNRRGRMIVDQHALNAMVTKEKIPHACFPATYNWICDLSLPLWDRNNGMLVAPVTQTPLSVVHLAGPDKRQIRTLTCTDGTRIKTPLTYEAIRTLYALR